MKWPWIIHKTFVVQLQYICSDKEIGAYHSRKVDIPRMLVASVGGVWEFERNKDSYAVTQQGKEGRAGTIRKDEKLFP